MYYFKKFEVLNALSDTYFWLECKDAKIYEFLIKVDNLIIGYQ